jgi:hypothetical protein
MYGHGCSTLPTDEEGRILDRLAGLEKIIPPALVRQVLHDTGRVNGRACELTHEVMMWVVLGMGLLTHLPIRQVFRHARRMGLGSHCPARSSLCAGRRRLGVEPLQVLHATLVRPLAMPNTPGAFYRRRRLMAFDGTVLDVPDSEANAVFGRSSGGRGEGAFPQVRKVSLVELGTHVETAMAIGGWHDDERTLARTLYGRIPDDALLLEDQGFFCYEDWKTLHLQVKLLIRVQSRYLLEPLRVLPDGSYLAKVYPTGDDRAKDRHGIMVRVIRYLLNDPQRTGNGKVHCLLTNLWDETECPALELVGLYHERWEEESVFDEQKTHQNPRRAEKPAQLRSETPEGVRQELYALSLGHFVIRSLMFAAAQAVQLDVDRLSFCGCFRLLQCRLPECDSRTPAALTRWYEGLLAEMQTEQTEGRRNRINPRVIKRKMSRWKKKRPEHRRPPPLQKTFAQCVVMQT